jgi:threonine synthase
MKNIKFFSTNGKSRSVSFTEALLKGQAPDLGLYMPEFVPRLSPQFFKDIKKMEYYEIAFHILKNFVNIPEEELLKISKEVYNFGIPLEKIYDRKYIMRLDRGPTCSFKDFATRMMARLMKYFLQNENKELIILTATSGDTGSAVANAFYNLEGIKVVVLFPEKEVSENQRKQMTTLGKNIFSLSVDGKFDDCQAIVKRAFADKEFSTLNLSSANSINIGRLLPQTVYYFYAYSRLAKRDEEIVFSIPSGNFGDMMGGLLANKMGLPISKFIIATNENDEFPKFLQTGKYKPIVPSKSCISNAMNVGHPSNLARLINLYDGQMDEKGNITKQPNMDSIREDIFSVSVSDNETRETIKDAYKKYKLILEPHGATGWNGLQRYLQKEKATLCVSLETAHPSKFPEEIEKTIGIKPQQSKSISELKNKKEKYENISADYDVFKDWLVG